MLGPPGLRQLAALATAAALALGVGACDVESEPANEGGGNRADGRGGGGDERSGERRGRRDGDGRGDRADRRGGRGAPRHGFPGPPDSAREARLIRVTDGDTIVLTGIDRVRLIGVDTPEVFGGVECYGREASAFTKRLLAGSPSVRYRLGIEERDRYGRALAYVWLDDGRMLNGLLVERGYATPLTIPPNVDFAEDFVAASRRARNRDAGLWSPDTCGGE